LEILSCLFLSTTTSLVTVVPADALNVLSGSLAAQTSSALAASSRLAELDFLSSVPEAVMNATRPPGRTWSSDLAKK